MRRQWLLRGAVFALLAGWAVYSLAELPPLDRALTPEEDDGPLYVLGAVGLPLYAFAAVRYVALYRRRPSAMPLAVAAAFTLLAEAMLAIVFGRNWHASWWEWHVLMAIAFGIVAAAARIEYRRRRSAAAVFKDLYLEHTAELVDQRYARALDRLVDRGGAGRRVQRGRGAAARAGRRKSSGGSTSSSARTSLLSFSPGSAKSRRRRSSAASSAT